MQALGGGDGVPTDGSTIALGLGGVATENQAIFWVESMLVDSPTSEPAETA